MRAIFLKIEFSCSHDNLILGCVCSTPRGDICIERDHAQEMLNEAPLMVREITKFLNEFDSEIEGCREGSSVAHSLPIPE